VVALGLKYSLLARVHYNRGENAEAKEWIGKAAKLQASAKGEDRLDNGHCEVLQCKP